MKAIFQLLNTFSTQGIFTTDTELKISSWNHWLEIYSGHSASEMIDLNLLEVYPELVTRQLDKCYRDALNGDTRVLAHRLHDYLLPMPSTSSSTTFVRMPQSAQILPLTKDDRIVGTITIIEDVTERLIREKELQSQVEERTRLLISEQEAKEALRKAHEGLEIIVESRTGELLNAILTLQEQIVERKLVEQRLAAQYAVTRILAESTNLHDTASKILQTICEGFGWDLGGLWRINRYSNLFHCVEIWHGSSVEAEEAKTINRQSAIPTSIKLPGWNWASGNPVWVTDLTEDPDFLGSHTNVKKGLHGACCIPILLGNEVLAIIGFFSHKVIQQDEEQLKMLTAIGHQIGQFIERKWSEEALRENEERYRTLFEIAPDAIVLFDSNLNIIMINQQGSALYGYKNAEELIGKSAYDLLSPEDRLRMAENADQILKDRGFRNIEYRALKKDGTSFPIESSASLIVDEEGKPKALIGLIKDITWRKRAEEEQVQLHMSLQKAVRDWQQTFDSIESLLLILDSGGRILRLNQSATRFLGKENYNEVLGKNVENIGHGQPWEKAAEIVRLVQESRSITFFQVHDQSSGKTWYISGILIKESAASDERIIIVARDITQMVRLQESVRHNEIMAEFGSLVAGVAHEVRNPLFSMTATIDAFEEVFRQREEYKEYIEVLRTELHRLTILMKELLDYGKPIDKEFFLNSIEILIVQAVQLCAPLAERLNVRIANKISEEGFTPIAMDQARLLQVFQNLIENAVQYSPPGGTITLEAGKVCRDNKDWIWSTIKDSGPGFQLDDLPKIYEPFFTKRHGGTGLGLAIAQKIVEQHGGRISAGNRPEGGASLQ